MSLRWFTAAAAVAALTALPVVAHAAPAGSCTATLLKLPAGAGPDGRSQVVKADDTGDFVVGRVDRGEFDFHPVLWKAGVPQWIDSAPGVKAWVSDVNSRGEILGTSLFEDDSLRPWVLSAGKYRLLEIPDYMSQVDALAINNHGDVVGHGISQFTEDYGALVWRRSGGAPQHLLMEDGRRAQAVDISDNRVVIGATLTDDNREIGVRWESWQQSGALVWGRPGNRSSLTEIRGHWTGGAEFVAEPSTFAGMLWTDLSTAVYPLRTIPASINSAGHAVVVDEADRTVIVTPDGTVRGTFAEEVSIKTLTDPGHTVDAAGMVHHGGVPHAATWSGCGPVDSQSPRTWSR